MPANDYTLTQQELSEIPEHLRMKVILAFSAALDYDGKVVCNGLKPNGHGGVIKRCFQSDPDGLAAEWMREWKEENKLTKELRALLAQQSWRPIAEAPKNGAPVDLWRWHSGERITNMRRVDLGNGNIFYEPISSGPSCVRDATHFQLISGPNFNN